MKPIDKTAPGQTARLHFECDLPHAPEKVWRALTDPALLSQWLLPLVAFEARPGSTFAFTAPPQPGWDGIVNCTVLAVERPKKLSYSWIVGEMDTVVAFTLAATATGTLLTVEHSGFTPTQKQNFGGARYGWNLMGGKLAALLEKTP